MMIQTVLCSTSHSGVWSFYARHYLVMVWLALFVRSNLMFVSRYPVPWSDFLSLIVEAVAR